MNTPENDNTTYKIIRSFRDNYDRPVIDTGLTLEEAQAHCKDPNTHGDSAQGPWFDGYEEE